MDKYREWRQSLHSKMIQEATSAVILADFARNNTLEHEGWHFRMTTEGGKYWIQELDPKGKKTRYQVTYTLGSKRIQHYLSMLPDGRIRVVFPTWDVRKGQWFHSSEIIPTGHHAEISIQIWNQHCYNCHVSQEKQGFDIATDTYRTTFTETGINCEMCHGPGSRHVKHVAAHPSDPNRMIIHPGKLPPQKQILVCAQCHAPRIILQNGFDTRENYFDYYMPSLMHFYIDNWYDPPMWADGRMRRFATEATALWQSQCYLKGQATCISCHNPHLNTISRDERFRDTDVLCTQCHESYRSVRKVASHTHHAGKSTGSHCIECHMPPTTNMIKDVERDHTISIPVPENSALYKIPNACNSCHSEKSPDWAVSWMDRWYSKRPKPNLRRANAFIPARKRDPHAIKPLIQLLGDPSENKVIRGSAAGFLGEFQGEEVARALVKALKDPDVMVRAEAARSLSEVHSESAIEPLKRQLRDPNKIVRLNSVFALIKMGVLNLEGPLASQFQKAKAEYVRFLKSFPDVYSIRVDLGTYYAVQNNYTQALAEYKNAIKLRADLPLAHYFLGITLAQVGELNSALSSFEKTLQLDPKFRNTRDLMAKVKEVIQNRK